MYRSYDFSCLFNQRDNNNKGLEKEVAVWVTFINTQKIMILLLQILCLSIEIKTGKEIGPLSSFPKKLTGAACSLAVSGH